MVQPNEKKAHCLLRRLVLGTLLLLSAATERVQAESGPLLSQAAPRTDLLGDPLPVGAVARLGSVRGKAGNTVASFAVSPDGKFFAGGGADRKTVCLWDAVSGNELRVLRGHQHEIGGV